MLVGTSSGRTIRTVLKEAREKLLESKAGHNVPVVAAGVFDILKGEGSPKANRRRGGVEQFATGIAIYVPRQRMRNREVK